MWVPRVPVLGFQEPSCRVEGECFVRVSSIEEDGSHNNCNLDGLLQD